MFVLFEDIMEDMICVKDVKYTYTASDDIQFALHDINLTVKEGEFLAIIGHNGSGKSTLAKHLNALLTPVGGDVWIDGMNTKDTEKVWEIRKTAGMVFQNPDNQLVATLVDDDVAFGPENLGVPPAQIRQRVDEALACVDMLDFKNKAPHMLSGGQKQRVAIAGVLALKPEIIVFDEPTAMLDPEGRREVLDTIRRLNREEGKTIVLITHYMEEAACADRIALMIDGRITFTGTPREVFENREEIKKAGMAAPVATTLYHALTDAGVDLGGCALNVEEMVDKLCPLL
jgi:energy-coupling factor transport system ATP-binding protein